MKVRCLLLLALLSFSLARGAGDPTDVQLFGRTFKLDTVGLRQLADFAADLHAEAAERQKDLAESKAVSLARRPAEEMTLEELKRLWAEPPNFINSKQRRGLNVLCQYAAKAAEASLNERAGFADALVEIADAIENNGRSPMPRGLELSFAPFILIEYMHRPVATGRTAANNLAGGEGPDSGTNDPMPGGFWRRPDAIGQQDLYAGFGRRARPRWETNLWSYAAPKTSFGNSPGFEVQAGGVHLKVKFWETISEPITARFFAALGYHVDPTDRAARLLVKYDRRLLKEFHLRKETFTQLYRFGIPVMTIPYQRRHDPFDYLVAAVLKNGQRISSPELKRLLFRDSERAHPEDDPSNFRENFEATVDHVVTVAANVQPDEAAIKSIGPWDFGRLGHADRRELRGACLVAAWLGWCDARFDNTRLKVVKHNGHTELRHYFSDLGGGLGKGTGFIGRKAESAEDMAWRITRPAEVVGRNAISRPFRIINYTPVDDNAAFARMTVDDARWMARLLGQITRRQLVDALASCDLDSGTIDLYTRKLVSRRDHIIRDLRLESEVPLLNDALGAPAELTSGN